MLKGVVRVLALVLLGLLAAAASFAAVPGSPDGAKAKDKNAKTAQAAANTTTATATATTATAAATEPTKSAATSSSAPAKPAKAADPQAKRKEPEEINREGVGDKVGEWVPMPGMNGTPGLFTLNTGDTLPKGAFSVTGFVDKYGRAPASLTVLNAGWRFGVGVTNRLSLFVGWDVYRHINLANPTALSLNSKPTKPVFDNTIYRIPFLPLSNRPSYVEDFPFAFENNGGIGPVMLGAEFGILSEQRGNPFSLAIRDEAWIPTKHGLANLLDNSGVQTGAFSDLIGVSASKTWADIVRWTFDYGYLFTRDPREGSQHLVTLADQNQIGTGFLFFPYSRIQILTEYDGVIYTGSATPTMTFGPRDPVEGLWGVRLYPYHIVALDLGYGYMMNLPQVQDRHAFIVKLSTEYWPSKVAPPDNVNVQCSIDKTSVQEGSNETVHLTAHGTDSYDHNLNYGWTTTGGSIRGSGSSVDWDTTGMTPGSYTATVRVDDGRNNTATCSETINVTPAPIPQPTLACSAAQPTVLPGQKVAITANVQDTSNTQLTYTWRTTGGAIVGTGPTVEFDTTGLAPGTYTITGRVENQKGGAADCSTDVTVQAPPPPKPQASKIDQCYFRERSSRVDNVCKRVLDNVALRLQNETGAHVVIIAYATPGKNPRTQREAERRAGERAENAKKYLVSKGVSADRVETRTGTATEGAGKENRRIEIIWVPEGATY
ncbi:MAG TPA: OmpA family protein [Candidatus Acidoferrales bacterium]|nr:OmpA family protein [Candidatus Acidoferrales bacterium]